MFNLFNKQGHAGSWPARNKTNDTNLYILHHLGLGDHFICKGLVLELAKNNENVFLFCKLHNFISVKHVYATNNNINIIPIMDDKQAENYIIDNNLSKLLLIGKNRKRLGHFNKSNSANYTSLLSRMPFDMAFYAQYNVPFEKRWTMGDVVRNYKNEAIFLKKMNPDNVKFAFVHDDPSRGFLIPNDRIINKKLTIIKPDVSITNNILDYCYLLEQASEIHCMDSSFKNLIESLKITGPELYFYPNLRGNNFAGKGSSRCNWMEILD